MLNNYSYLDDVAETKINTANFDFNLEKFETDLYAAAKEKKDLDIQIPDAQKNYQANVLAVRELINSAVGNIRIFSTDISDHLYGKPNIIYTFHRWLETNPERRIQVLLKNDIDIESRYFNLLYHFFPDQIEIRVSELSDIDKCHRNSVLIDQTALKVKEVINNKEMIAINFNAPEETKKLVRLFDHLMSKNNSRSLAPSSGAEYDHFKAKEYGQELIDDIEDFFNRKGQNIYDPMIEAAW